MSGTRITMGLALLVTAIAVIGRAIPVISVPLILFAVFLIIWGREPRATEVFIGGLPLGNYILKGLGQIDSILTPRDREFDQYIKSIIKGYDANLLKSLRVLYLTRNARNISPVHWDQFNQDTLVDYPHAGPSAIKTDLRVIVGRTLDELGV